jgi:hypothetical protein
MRKYIISMKMIEMFLARANNSFIGKTLIDYDKMELTLYNSNANTNHIFKIVDIPYTHYGLIIETDNIPSHFKNCFIEIIL